MPATEVAETLTVTTDFPPSLAAEYSVRLGVPVALAVATDPVPLRFLSFIEHQTLRSIASDEARRSWLLGRAALRALLPCETSRLTFPDTAVSLTHSGQRAVAAKSGAPLAGIGVDFEPWRAEVRPRMMRFFLRPSEHAAAQSARNFLRLWTIKEALFKAFPGNADCVLLDFELRDPHASSGTATGPGGRTLRYASVDVVPGCLSIAVTTLRGNDVAV